MSSTRPRPVRPRPTWPRRAPPAAARRRLRRRWRVALGRLRQACLDAPLAWLLPGRCTLCASRCGGPVCAGCAARLRAQTAGPRVATPPGADPLLALGPYQPPWDRLVTGLKYRQELALAGWIATRLAHAHRETAAALPDLFVPIPLPRRRLVARGYNQAWEIARRLAARLGRPASATLLRRRREDRPQVGLTLARRRRNLAGAMHADTAVEGLHIGIVDDVSTSGATLVEAARALRAAGAARISCYVALRTPDGAAHAAAGPSDPSD